MKKQFKFSLIALLLVIVCIASVAVAVTPSRDSVTLVLGAGGSTNTEDYVVKKLIRVDVSGVQPASVTGTISWVSDNLTNQIGTVICTSGAGTYYETQAVHVFKSGKLVFAIGTNAGTVRATFDNYP